MQSNQSLDKHGRAGKLNASRGSRRQHVLTRSSVVVVLRQRQRGQSRLSRSFLGQLPVVQCRRHRQQFSPSLLRHHFSLSLPLFSSSTTCPVSPCLHTTYVHHPRLFSLDIPRYPLPPLLLQTPAKQPRGISAPTGTACLVPYHLLRTSTNSRTTRWAAASSLVPGLDLGFGLVPALSVGPPSDDLPELPSLLLCSA